jgi:leucyl aminopeptidase
MKFHLESRGAAALLKRLDVALIPVRCTAEGKPVSFGALFDALSAEDKKLVTNYLALRARKPGEAKLLRLNDAPGFVLLATEKAFTEQSISLMIRRTIRTAKAEGFAAVGICADDYASSEHGDVSAATTCRLIASNALYAHYDFSEQFKTPPAEGWRQVKSVVIFTTAAAKQCKEMLAYGEVVAEGVNQCRSIANMPPSDLKPEGMAEAARTVAGDVTGITVTIFDEKRLRREGMNAILAVGQGSASPPRLIVMEYAGGKKGERPLALVGKGVTFDSGGLNLKPGESMADMHMDMSGGAAVIFALRTIAKLKLPLNVIGVVPAVENMVSGFSYRQGDIIRSYGGKTIEVANTDAEGRVILADAIAYALTKKPALTVEISTLTGAAEVALGQRVAALFVKNNKPLQDALQEIGTASGDEVWPLPLWDIHEKDVESSIADLVNLHRTGSRWGGAITGAAFLSAIAGTAPFVHIDMAPRMVTLPDEEYLARGAAGFGVRFFTVLASRWEQIQSLVK